MADGEGAGAQGAQGGGGEQGQQGATSAGGAALGGGGAAAPEWLSGLPDDLKGDATLSRYQNVEALARGHIETKKLASSRLAVPGAEAKPEDWAAVFDALGRPKEAKDYEIPLPDGVKEESPMAAAFRETAHKLGLLPDQVKGAVSFFNDQMGQAQAAYLAAGEAEVEAVKAELGADYEPQREAAKKAIGNFFDVEDVDLLDQVLGSGKLVRGAMKLAKAMGEHGRIDGDGDGGGFGGGLANAEQQLQALFADKGWREKYNAGDTATVAQHDKLLNAARAQALSAQAAAAKAGG